MCPLPPVRASMITSLLATILSACVQSPSISEMSPQDEKSGVLFAEWVELGTRSGPIPGTDRSQPSHLLRVDNQVILVDVGDGTTQQLAKAGVGLGDVDAVFISHLHFDHTGGLFAFLSLRYQSSSAFGATPLAIYGPPGTASMVRQLDAATLAAAELLPATPPAHEIHELSGGASVTIGEILINAVENSHYDLIKPTESAQVSLSFRFDIEGRSVVYTGDTGPSAELEEMALGADLLVSEIMDAETAIIQMRESGMHLTDETEAYVRAHFTRQHLTPDEVGKLAASTHVKSLVLTHFGGASDDPQQIPRLTRQIAQYYDGPIHFAEDLDAFEF